MQKLVTIHIFLLILFFGCKDSNNPIKSSTGPDGKISLGETVNLISKSIGPSGGSIKIEKSGDILNGMELTIAPNSFLDVKTFEISYAEIKSHKFGEYFNPISPAVKVRYEGGYSETPMSVKIPIKVSNNDFAMGFFYDEASETLEGIPIESLDSNFITISTRTFSSYNFNKLNKSVEIPIMLQMLIGSVSQSLLESKAVIASSFTPGYDDWEFVNFGSYIAPGGHCAGQSMTAMWYYYEKNIKGAPNLFHRFDLVNDKLRPNLLWQDNPLGYRFASIIQKDFDFNGWIRNLEFKTKFPGLIFKAFAASILITGEPQFVLIKNSAGLGGHAMIVYKVNYNDGKLYIADPNYPNNRVALDGSESVRTINYINGILGPYETGLTAGAGSIPMDQIGYFGKTTYIDWSKIGKRWLEVENKTIGNSSFPEYQIKVVNDGEKKLIDGFNTTKDELKFYCKSPTAGCLNGTDNYLWSQVFDINGNKISNQADELKGIPAIPLKIGQNKIGIYMRGNKNGNWHYIDFKWINVNRYKMNIEPNILLAKKGNEIKLTAKTFGSAPNQYKMVWNFGDNSSPITVQNDSIVKYTYNIPETYEVKATMYNIDNTKLVDADSKVIVSSFDWNWPYVQIVIRDITANVELYSPYHNNRDTISWTNLTFGHQVYKVKKEGNYFNGEKDSIYDYGTYQSHHIGEIKLTVNENNFDVLSFELRDSSLYDLNMNSWSVAGLNIPRVWISHTGLHQIIEKNVLAHLIKLKWEKTEGAGLTNERRFKLLNITDDTNAKIEIYWASEPY